MDRAKAEELANLVREECPHSKQFRIEEERQTPLEGFHSWADGKDSVGAFLIRRVRDDVAQDIGFFLSIIARTKTII